jgi:hypothetical protein
MRVLTAAIRAELVKITTVPGVWVCTAVIVALDVLVLTQQYPRNVEMLASLAADGTVEVAPGERRPATDAFHFLLVSALQIAPLLPVLGALIAGQEFRAGQIGLSVLAVPRRGLLSAAKALAAGLFLLLVAALLAAVDTVFVELVVADWEPGLPFTGEAFLWRARFLVLAVSFGLAGFAIALVARSTLAGVAGAVALTMVTMTQVLARVAPAVDALLPYSAARNLMVSADDLTAGPGHALLVLAGWALAAPAVAGLVLARRDAR